MQDSLYTAIVDGQLSVPIDKGHLESIDCTEVDQNLYHILSGHQSVLAEVESFDSAHRSFVIKLGGNRFVIAIKDRYDLLVDRLGLTKSVGASVSDVYAPMPGLVLDLLVQPGQTVEAGQPLLILEAMKMENIIKAGGEGIVESIQVSNGTTVDKGQLLVSMK